MEETKKVNKEIAEVESEFDSKAMSEKSERNEGRERPAHFERGRVKSEYDQKAIEIRRVTRVVAGGRRMSFAVALLVGDRKGSIGLGTGKAVDTALAMNKALRNAKKNVFKVKMNEDNSIAHEIEAKFKSARVMLMPNRARGLVAGSAMRDILKLGGLRNVTAKIFSGSKNKLNIARATINALKQL